MTFITNNTTWSPSSICDLYKCRWGVEVFFKQIKQTLQLADFLGHSRNAILWQVWMALLAYVLIRFIGHLGQWEGAFGRLFTLLRGVLFSRLDAYQCCPNLYLDGIFAGMVYCAALTQYSFNNDTYKRYCSNETSGGVW